MKFLAVDIGASSGRTIVGDIEGGRITLNETYRFPNGMVDIDGEKHWDVESLLSEVKKGIAASGDVDGIGIDTWGVDYGIIGADGKLVEQPFAYRDSRHEPIPAEVYKTIPKVRLYRINGIQEMSINTIFQLMWDRLNRPELLDNARHILMMPQLLTYLLTGEATAEYTICSTSGLLDASGRDWADELLDLVGVSREQLGEIKLPGAAAGSYQGTPVYLPGGHDTASAVAAVPAIGEGDWAYVSSGTWSLIGAELEQPILTPHAVQANFTNEGGVDGSIRFLKNINGLWLIQECRRIWAEQGNKLDYAAIAAEAAKSDFASTIDPNDSRFMAPKDMVHELQEACRESGQAVPESVGEVARCCYLSLAQAYREQLDLLAEVTGKSFQRLHVVGGGCQVDLLNQLTADYCGIPVVTGPVEATALGNICLQAMANGVFASLDEVRMLIAHSFPVTIYQPND